MARQKAHWTEGGHKNSCKELSRASHEWFLYPDEVSHIVKRTGLDRPAVLSLLQEYKNKKGSGFPAKFANGVEAEDYAMSVWVYDTKMQLKSLDDSLNAMGIKPTTSSSSSWVSWMQGRSKDNSTLEALHQEWVKGGRAKASTHESFFDTDFLVAELKLMRKVRCVMPREPRSCGCAVLHHTDVSSPVPGATRMHAMSMLTDTATFSCSRVLMFRGIGSFRCKRVTTSGYGKTAHGQENTLPVRQVGFETRKTPYVVL
jgi:hypothetical protein